MGNPTQFCASADLAALAAATPAVYGVASAGPRPKDAITRQVRLNQALARDAISSDLDLNRLHQIQEFRIIETRADTRAAHLNSPDLGAQLSSGTEASLAPERARVQILVSDGLSAEAVNHNVPELLPVVLDGLAAADVEVGRPLVARFGRVKLAEPVALRLDALLIVLLIGERPGGMPSSRSMSAYLVYRLKDQAAQAEAARFSRNPQVAFEYTVISNIYSGGLPPVEAGSEVVEKAVAILRHRAAGNRLETLLSAQ